MELGIFESFLVMEMEHFNPKELIPLILILILNISIVVISIKKMRS